MGNLWQCTICDSPIDESGRVGHLKFSDGDGHGPKQDFPDDYQDNPGDYYIPVPSDEEPEDESGNGDGEASETPSPSDTPTSGRQPNTGDTPDSNRNNDRVRALAERVRDFLTTPLGDH